MEKKKRKHLLVGIIVGGFILLLCIGFILAYTHTENGMSVNFDNVFNVNTAGSFDVTGCSGGGCISVDPDGTPNGCISGGSVTNPGHATFTTGSSEGTCTIQVTDGLSNTIDVIINITNVGNTIGPIASGAAIIHPAVNANGVGEVASDSGDPA
jgi:hypothetical protein